MTAVSTCIAALLALLVAEYRRMLPLKVVAKLAASSAFVIAALQWGALDSLYGKSILVGLCLCWLGDACLLPEGAGKFFLAGLLAFLCGHVAYSIAFLQLQPDANWIYSAAPVALLIGLVVLRWLWPALARNTGMKLPVIFYVAVILGMVLLASAATFAGASALVVLGAAGFAISDLAVARERFFAVTFFNRAWGLPAYYGSQLLLAYTIALH